MGLRRRLGRTDVEQRMDSALDELSEELTKHDRPLGEPVGPFTQDIRGLLGDCLLMDATGATRKVYLPALERGDVGKALTVVIFSASANSVQVIPPPGVEINGTAGVATMLGAWSSLTFVAVAEKAWFATAGASAIAVGGVTKPAFAAYAEIYCYDYAVATTIAASGIGNKVQFAGFDTNGSSLHCTPDHTNDHITCAVAGYYLIVASITGQSASANQEIGHGVWLNNGASEMQNVHAHRSYQTANKVGSISLSGVSLLAVDDTVELWVYNDTAGNDVLLSDVSLAVTRMDA